ncbi:MAG: outer membrane protein assembly factor BamB [Wenzhouxiangella sp.]|nr:outer membrane protein assembly factor BamB [Wenzhouxiangella sp.]
MSHLARVFILAALLLGLAGCQTIGGWFDGDDEEQGPAELVEFSPTVQPREIWAASISRDRGRSRPGLRPVYDSQEIWVADPRGRISAVNADSGDAIKRFETELPLSAGPRLAEERAFVGTFDGELVALNRDDGTVVWRAQLSSEVLSMPVIQDDVVVVRCVDGRVFGVDVQTGARIWVYDRSVPLLTLRGSSDPLGRAGQVFIGHEDGAVSALRAADGSLLWQQRVSVPEGRTELDQLSDIDGPMVIVGSELYAVTYKGQLAGLTLDSGRILWTKDVSSHQGVSLQRTQLAIADRDDAVWLVDRRNGATLWRDDRLARRGITRPVFFRDFLVTADQEGYLHWYDAERGEFAARTRIGRNAPAAAPLVVGNTLYVLDVEGRMTAWRVET